MATFKPPESAKDQKCTVAARDENTRCVKLGDVTVEQCTAGDADYVVRVSFEGKTVERRYQGGTLDGVNRLDLRVSERK